MADARSVSGWPRGVPRNLEAYPRYDVVRGEAACIREESVCHFINEQDLHLGVLFVGDSSDTSVTLEFTVHGPYIPYAFGRVTLAVEFAPNGVNPEHRFLRCRGCGARKSIVIFKGEWRCARCHGLRYRAQLVDKHTLKRERFDTLKQLVGKGRPHRMHRDTYGALVAELNELKRELRGTHAAYASVAHSRLIRSEWRSLKESWREVEGFSHYRVCGDQIDVDRDWPGYREFGP